jgi:hypothetical protein
LNGALRPTNPILDFEALLSNAVSWAGLFDLKFTTAILGFRALAFLFAAIGISPVKSSRQMGLPQPQWSAMTLAD